MFIVVLGFPFSFLSLCLYFLLRHTPYRLAKEWMISDFASKLMPSHQNTSKMNDINALKKQKQ